MIIIKKPVVTEKTISEYKTKNKVTFEVALDANKFNAKKAIEDVYGVTVLETWTNTRLGKKKSDPKSRKPVTKTGHKKIMVFKLKKGDKLKIFDQ